MTIRNTLISDLIPSGTEHVLSNLISLGIAEGNEFATAGVLASAPYVTAQANDGPRKFTIPFLNDLDGSVFNVSSDDLNQQGDVHNITGDDFDVIKLALNNGWGDADLARMVTGVDSLAEISSRVTGYWNKVQKTLFVSALNGVKTKVAQVSGTAMSVGLLANAAAALGENYEIVDTLVVSPTARAAMITADVNQFVPASKTDTKMDTYAGYKVVVSGAVADGEAYLLGSGAFAYAAGAPALDTEVERVANGANGAGGNILHSRRNFIIHPQGFDFVGGSFKGTDVASTKALYSTAANWALKVPTDQVRMVHVTITGE